MIAKEMVHVIYLALVITHLSSRHIQASNIAEHMSVKPLQDLNSITYNITVLTNASSTTCNKEFLSVTIDTNAVKNNWTGINFSSTKFQNLAKALSPINLRFGGTLADFLIFYPNNTIKRDNQGSEPKGSLVFDQNFVMSGNQWDELTTFVKKVGWNLTFDFNEFLRNGGGWNSSNAALLLNYSAAKGIEIPSFELGNEPDLYAHAFNVTITPSDLVADFKTLKSLLTNYNMYRSSTLYGPGVTNLGVHYGSTTYLRLFIEAGGADVVDEINLHHYYLNGQIAKLEDCFNVTILDSLKTVLDMAFNLTKVVQHPVGIHLSETSSFYNGGAPNLSNAYVSGFLWLDKLGISALYGLTKVTRQSFIGSSYELISSGSFNPNPDFYLSLLFKRLVEGPVFPVISQPESAQVRVYAHCARIDFFRYPSGALVLYYLNLGESNASLSIKQFSNADQDLFLLTPGDNQGLHSRAVRLNGQVLLMSGDDVPQTLPKHHRGDILVGPKTFGFIVIPQANVPACLNYH